MGDITITLVMTLKPETADAFCDSLQEMFKDTAGRPGFRSIRAIRHKDDPNQLLLLETWQDQESYENYVAWRAERGDSAGLGDILAAPPRLDMWSVTVAAA